MILYHGSYQIIEHPDTEHSRKRLDFGQGFYLTPLESQAVRWVQKYKRQDLPGIINQYQLHEDKLHEYRIKTFLHYDSEWLRFAVQNRQGHISSSEYDLIRGGIANDKVFNTIELYLEHLISEEETLGRLQYHKPSYQICITSQELLDQHLIFQSYYEV